MSKESRPARFQQTRNTYFSSAGLFPSLFPASNPWELYSLIIALWVCAAPKGMVFVPFRSERRIDFAYFGLNSGMVFEGIREGHERICRFNFK